MDGYIAILIAVEQYIKSIQSRYQNTLVRRFEIENLFHEKGSRGIVLKECLETITVVETCVYRIVAEFYDMFDRVEVREEFVDRMQRFMDFNQ